MCDEDREEIVLNCFFFLLKSLQIRGESWVQLPILVV